MHEDNAIWARKGATFSDKSARQEFGLTQQEIFAAMLTRKSCVVTATQITCSETRARLGRACNRIPFIRTHFAWRCD